MKLPIRSTTTYVTVGLAAAGMFALAVLFWLFSATGFLGAKAHADTISGRLITVHDRGQTTSFVTDKPTLKEALADAGVEISEHDTVEPALDQSLIATDYQVNIYRARPVTIIDGALRQKVVTPYQSAERILQDAGITLYSEDTTTLTRSSDIINDGAGLQLVIDRATPLTLDLYGAITSVRTQAETVGEMLKEKAINLGADGRASLPLDAPIVADMTLRVWREGKQTVTATEAVDFKVQHIQDADQPKGYKQVQTQGVPGERTVTYEIEIQNGVEVARIEIASITVLEPITQVEVIGMKPNTLPYVGGGTKTDWLAASNIPELYWGYADFMVQKESSWNPNAVNRFSGACGLAQALPCSKLGPNWNNPVVALNWMNDYVNGRYGGWEGAYTFWVTHRWY